MNQKIKAILLSILALSLSGCLKTRSEISGTRSQQEAQAQQQAAQRELQQQEINDQIRSLVGRIDVLESQMSTISEKVVEKGVASQEGEKKKVERLDALEKVISEMDLKLLALSNEIRVYLKSQKATKKAAPQKPKGNFARAEDDFKAKRWKEAIVGYEKYRELNPKGRRYAVSTYKIGVCFQELSMADAAKSFFQEVLDKFPKSSEAKKAKYRLSKIKK